MVFFFFSSGPQEEDSTKAHPMVYNSPSRFNSAAPLDVRFRNLGSYKKAKTAAAKKGGLRAEV